MFKTDKDKESKKMMTDTITITYGERVENHVGMQMIGELGEEGLEYEDLAGAKEKFEKEGYKCEMVCLNDYVECDEDVDPCDIDDTEKAYILIVKKGSELFTGSSDGLYKEQKGLEWDKHAWMKGRVVNKRARYNLCYDEKSQEPDYENKKGRVVAFEDIPLTYSIKKGLGEYFGEKCKDLKAEGNYYFDKKDCGIGYHGDSERKIVIAVRVGATIPICYHWYQNSARVGKKYSVDIEHGDLYAMSFKATGFDWKKRKILTLRHAAGSVKFTK